LPPFDKLRKLSHDPKKSFQTAVLPLLTLSSPPLDKELGINSGGNPGAEMAINCPGGAVQKVLFLRKK
jgi:hypothetical protein